MHPAKLQKTAQEWPDERAPITDLASELPCSQYSCASMGRPSTSLIHRDPTSQPTELKGSTTNALAPETTGRPQRSCVHALMG